MDACRPISWRIVFGSWRQLLEPETGGLWWCNEAGQRDKEIESVQSNIFLNYSRRNLLLSYFVSESLIVRQVLQVRVFQLKSAGTTERYQILQ